MMQHNIYVKIISIIIAFCFIWTNCVFGIPFPSDNLAVPHQTGSFIDIARELSLGGVVNKVLVEHAIFNNRLLFQKWPQLEKDIVIDQRDTGFKIGVFNDCIYIIRGKFLHRYAPDRKTEDDLYRAVLAGYSSDTNVKILDEETTIASRKILTQVYVITPEIERFIRSIARFLPGELSEIEEVEYVDIIDENGNQTGEVKPKSLVHKDGDWHQTANVILMDRKGNLVLQVKDKRHELGHSGMKTIPGGHVKSGMNHLDTAVDEIRDEIGITVERGRMIFLGYEYYDSTKYEGHELKGKINREKRSLWLYILDDADVKEILARKEQGGVSETKEIIFQPFEDAIREIERLNDNQDVYTPDMAMRVFRNREIVERIRYNILLDRFHIIPSFKIPAGAKVPDVIRDGFNVGRRCLLEVKGLPQTVEEKEFYEISGVLLHPKYFREKKLFNLTNPELLRMAQDGSLPLYRIVKELKPRVVSVHIGYPFEDVGLNSDDNIIPVEGEIVLDRQETKRRIIEGILAIKGGLEKIGYGGEFLVETLDYNDTGGYEYICKPEFIKEVLEETGCGLLIDCAHLLVSSFNLGYSNYMDYVKQVVTPENIASVKEVHISAPRFREGSGQREMVDRHRCLSSDEELLENQMIRNIFGYILMLREREGLKADLIVNFETDAGKANEELDSLERFLSEIGRNIVKQSLPKVSDIVFVTPEITPFSKTGGLADVSNELSKAIAGNGINVNVITLRYKNTPSEGLVDTGLGVNVRVGDSVYKAKIWEKRIGSLTIYFMENGELTGEIYSGDSLKQALFLSEGVFALVELWVKIGRMNPPQVMHANDWQTALVPVFLKTKYQNHPIFSKVTSVFSIHNLAYQGGVYNRFPYERFKELGIGDKHWFGLEKPFDPGGFNLMRGAIYHSDKIVAVSPNYSREIQTSEYGCGLDNDLMKRTSDLVGIINGVDSDEWEPVSIEDKPNAKERLQRLLDLDVNPRVPLIGIATRISEQKNVEHTLHVIERLLIETNGEIQFVFMGKGHPDDPYFHKMKTEMGRIGGDERWYGKVKFLIESSHEKSKRIFQGIDIYLMPSKFEPCGTKQQVALINAVPVVARRTGGLVDTVWEYNPETGEGNGFLFDNIDEEEFYQALERALHYYAVPSEWEKIMRNARTTDRSWNLPAQRYIDLYREALKRKYTYIDEDRYRALGRLNQFGPFIEITADSLIVFCDKDGTLTEPVAKISDELLELIVRFLGYDVEFIISTGGPLVDSDENVLKPIEERMEGLGMRNKLQNLEFYCEGQTLRVTYTENGDRVVRREAGFSPDDKLELVRAFALGLFEFLTEQGFTVTEGVQQVETLNKVEDIQKVVNGVFIGFEEKLGKAEFIVKNGVMLFEFANSKDLLRNAGNTFQIREKIKACLIGRLKEGGLIDMIYSGGTYVCVFKKDKMDTLKRVIGWSGKEKPVVIGIGDSSSDLKFLRSNLPGIDYIPVWVGEPKELDAVDKMFIPQAKGVEGTKAVFRAILSQLDVEGFAKIQFFEYEMVNKTGNLTYIKILESALKQIMAEYGIGILTGLMKIRINGNLPYGTKIEREGGVLIISSDILNQPDILKQHIEDALLRDIADIMGIEYSGETRERVLSAVRVYTDVVEAYRSMVENSVGIVDDINELLRFRKILEQSSIDEIMEPLMKECMTGDKPYCIRIDIDDFDNEEILIHELGFIRWLMDKDKNANFYFYSDRLGKKELNKWIKNHGLKQISEKGLEELLRDNYRVIEIVDIRRRTERRLGNQLYFPTPIQKGVVALACEILSIGGDREILERLPHPDVIKSMYKILLGREVSNDEVIMIFRMPWLILKKPERMMERWDEVEKTIKRLGIAA